MVIVVAFGIFAAAVFVFSGPSTSREANGAAPEEASRVFGVWRAAETLVDGQNTTVPGTTFFMEISEDTFAFCSINHGQLNPQHTGAITWGFHDGTLCFHEEKQRNNQPFLKRITDSGPEWTRYDITFVDENTIHMEGTITSGKTVTTSVSTLVRSSPDERDAAIIKRLANHKEFDPKLRAPAPSGGEAPVAEIGAFEPADGSPNDETRMTKP